MKEFTPIILVMIIGIVSILVFIKFESSKSKPGDEQSPPPDEESPSPDEESFTFPVVNIESVSVYDFHTYREKPNNPELALKNMNNESTLTEVKLSDNSHGFTLKDFWFEDDFPIVFTWKAVNLQNNVNKIKIKIGKYNHSLGYWYVQHTKVYDRTIENLDYFTAGVQHIYQYNLDGGRHQTTAGNYIITIDYSDFEGNEYSFPGKSEFIFRIEEEYLGLSSTVVCDRNVTVTPIPEGTYGMGGVFFSCGENEFEVPYARYDGPYKLPRVVDMTEYQCPEIIQTPARQGKVWSFKVDVSDCLGEEGISQNGRCGPNHGGTQCPGKQCCSENGWCGGEKGISDAYCLYIDHGSWNGDYDGRY